MTPFGIAFGEALIDCFPDRRVVAGAPLHVAVHLAALGWRSALVTRLGGDEDGAEIRRVLEERGVETEWVETDPRLPTGRVTIAMSGTCHRFAIGRPAAWDAIEGPARLPPHDAFVFGSLAARDARSAGTLRRLLASAGTRVFDVNLRPPDVPADFVREGLQAADVLKLNEDEEGTVAGLAGIDAEPAAWFRAARRLRFLCRTLGERGAALHARDGRSWTVEGPRFEVVDTVGAGDAFTAGLADGLTRGRPPQEALAHAQALATRIVQQRGGLP